MIEEDHVGTLKMEMENVHPEMVSVNLTIQSFHSMKENNVSISRLVISNQTVSFSTLRVKQMELGKQILEEYQKSVDMQKLVKLV